MKRNIIEIDEKLCIGCSLCVDTCHQGALQLVDGKAKLMSEDYCDGLGRCLPTCPTGAITIIEKEFATTPKPVPTLGSCPSSMAKSLSIKKSAPISSPITADYTEESQLANWPVQIQLAPVNAPYFDGADLLIAADCTAFACARFHKEFLEGRVCLIGCPKLDNDYSDKLSEIFASNNISSITVLRMEVPCCGGIVEAVKTALAKSQKVITWGFKIIGLDGILK